jgi:hypothetical protein
MHERKSPEQSATLYKIGTKKIGNDNNTWIITENKNGIKKWTIYKKPSKKILSSSFKKFTVDDAAKKINKLITIYCREYKDELPEKNDWKNKKDPTYYKLKFRPNGNAGILGKKNRLENWLISQKPEIKNKTFFVIDGELYEYINNKWTYFADGLQVSSGDKKTISPRLMNTECFIKI